MTCTPEFYKVFLLNLYCFLVKQWPNYDVCCKAKQLLGKSIKISEKTETISNGEYRKTSSTKGNLLFIWHDQDTAISLYYPEKIMRSLSPETHVSCWLMEGILARHPSPVSEAEPERLTTCEAYKECSCTHSSDDCSHRHEPPRTADQKCCLSRRQRFTLFSGASLCFTVLCGVHSVWFPPPLPDKLLKSIRCGLLQRILWVRIVHSQGVHFRTLTLKNSLHQLISI